MTVKILVLLGCLLSISHEAAIVSMSASSNRSLEISSTAMDDIKQNFVDGLHLPSYVKVPSGASIYFFVTENENSILGHKLRSDEEVVISFIKGSCHQNNSLDEFDDSISHTGSYVILENGVLIPKTNLKKKNGGSESPSGERNRCVYQSLKPIYYVKGFKNILIPVDVLYSKSIQDELFDDANLDEKYLNGRKESKAIGTESDEPEIIDMESDRKLTFPSSDIDEVDERSNEIIEDKTDPDKTCSGEVTLFVLKSDGVLKRVTADPYIPIGLHVTYSLLNNFILQPKFLGGSDLVMSYVTGENGDLIPHPQNTNKITSEVGTSVLFMLSKNGGLFPVTEKRRNELIRYYFDGKLIHESHQSSEIYSNSTAVLVNKERFQLFDGDVLKNKLKPREFKDDFRDFPKVKENAENGPRRHRLRKREAYYERVPGGPLSQNPVKHHSTLRQIPVKHNYMVEHSTPPLRNHEIFLRRTDPGMSDIPSMANDGPLDSMAEENPQGPGKLMAPQFEMNRKSASSVSSAIYPEGTESMEHAREEMSEVVTPYWDRTLLRPRTDIFIFDEKGNKIRLIPEITESNDVVIYKLTCKGNLIRYPSCKEPEFGFEINFQLLLDEFVLVPTISANQPFLITYVLQENGDLIPAEGNTNTFRKAPGSLIYYMLGKNNVLFPVQQVIDMEGNVSFFYQHYFLFKMKDSVEKPLHFTTKGTPLFAFFNGLTMISMSSKPRLNSRTGSNWNQLKISTEEVKSPPKTMFLTGPKGEMIKITPYKNRQGATVVYELDCNGILYRSPKDKKKCIILKSYILLKEGILLPSNDTNGYVYMMSKNGDLFPYLYPDGKIEAPLACSLKYVLCEKGILLPITLEIIDSHICYIFQDVVVYKERVYYRSCLDRLNEQQICNAKKRKKSSCDIATNATNISNDSDIKLFVNKNNEYVYYYKEGKILKRYPPESVPSYLKYTMGSFEVRSDGSLYQIRYQDPSENVINLMLEPNGDLLEDSRNTNNVRSEYYVLDEKGNLISVGVRKTKKSLYFYKNSKKVCKVSLPETEDSNTCTKACKEAETPLGEDPLKLMEDPCPGKTELAGDTQSLYIPIPLKSISVSNSPESCQSCGDSEHKKKCDMLKETLNEVSKGNSLPLALELELNDEIIEELRNWATKCDKVLSRRETNENLKSYLNTLKELEMRKATNI